MIKIERAAPTDLDPVLALDRRCSQVFRERQAYADLQGAAGLLLVAREANDLLGFAAYSMVLDEATLVNVVVSSDWRSRGVGHALLAEAESRLRERGVSRLLLELRVGNAPALKLYRKHGFCRDGERSGYYPGEAGGPAEDALLMSKRLESAHARA